jgi:hypothetical protein
MLQIVSIVIRTIKAHLHLVKETGFVHVVDVFPSILVKELVNGRQCICKDVHVHQATFVKAAKLMNPMAGLECFQPAIGKLERIMARMEMVQNLLYTLLDEVATQVDVLLVGLEPISER